MTVEEYINNPSGGRVGALQREAYKSAMSERLDKILVRDNNSITYHCYKDDKGKAYWLHMEVPSEVIKGFHYDTIIKFTKPKGKVEMGNANLDKYQVHFFSNDPAFVYTHVYVYNKNDLFIRELSGRMAKTALTHRPVDTNTNEVVDYCKSIYWALLIAKQKGLFNSLRYTAKFSLKDLEKQIIPAEDKIRDRQEKDEEQKAKKKKESSAKQPARTPAPKATGPINFNKLGKVNFSPTGTVGGKPKGIKHSLAPNFNKNKKV